jgi:hypothetical protein
VTTIPSEVEVVAEEPAEIPTSPSSPDATVTEEPAFPDAREVIARVAAAYFEEDLMARGYFEMGGEMLEWSETSLAAQAETLPEE